MDAKQIVEEAKKVREFKDWGDLAVFLLNEQVYGWNFIHPITQEKLVELLKVAPLIHKEANLALV